MCDLTTRWILESAQSFSVCTYYNMDLTMFDDSSGERKLLIPQNERELRHSEGSVMLIGGPLRCGEQC